MIHLVRATAKEECVVNVFITYNDLQNVCKTYIATYLGAHFFVYLNVLGALQVHELRIKVKILKLLKHLFMNLLSILLKCKYTGGYILSNVLWGFPQH